MAVCSTLFRQIAVESGMFLYLLLSKQDAEVAYRKRLKMKYTDTKISTTVCTRTDRCKNFFIPDAVSDFLQA